MEKYDDARKRLEAQYLDVKYDPASGLSKEQLVAELERHRAENPEEPRIMTRAWLFRLLCSKARIAVEPDDYFADKLEHHNLMLTLRTEWKRAEEQKEFKNDPPSIPGVWGAQMDTGHTCPDWRNLLKYGFPGLRDRAAARSGVFYQAVAMVYDGAIILSKRFAAALPNVAIATAAMAALAERPPQTFHEALQLAYLYHELQEMEDGYSVRTLGRFDQLYYGFYANDLKAGRLTRDGAKELIKYFWVRFYAKTQGKLNGKPFLFGPDVNELSYLAFEVYKEIQNVELKFHVRLAERTPQDFLEKVAECIQAGSTSIQTFNDDKQVEMLRLNGRSREDASDYIIIGCCEPAVMGKEMNCSGAAGINLAKVVELVLASGDYATFDELMEAYIKTLDAQFAISADKTRREERLWPKVNPSPLLSGTMDSCLEKGRDVSQAGAKYNITGYTAYGIANAADSLAVIKQLVYDERRCTLAELRAALAANWKGYEELRLTAQNRVPKWGNNDDRVDSIAVRITDFLGPRINREPNARGGVFHAALYAIIDSARNFGQLTGALPDGRLAGEHLTMNTSASTGRDKKGVTSLINSVTKVNLSLFPMGTTLDIMLHPSAVRGREGIETICSIVRSHFAQGGMAIQFNIFDAAALRDAQRHPEKYANLQVRVSGWNVRFVDLAPAEQEIFIVKAENANEGTSARHKAPDCA
ncbi:MAG: hypothetical protein KJ964_03845 [Verrucomicrobia bacterium]|nr:hypothetical protein [Verrucomicrobiota bacterium]MBU1736372.1 hypothetical protein [Verrucomicrobiota bacterium]MBU1857589.1 hypothetical protein [Verrucomicrobiota bacterium]